MLGVGCKIYFSQVSPIFSTLNEINTISDLSFVQNRVPDGIRTPAYLLSSFLCISFYFVSLINLLSYITGKGFVKETTMKAQRRSD